MRWPFLLAFVVTACGSPAEPQLGTREEGLTICDGGVCYTCNGNLGTTQPADGLYVMTTFGGGSDTQPVACGGRQADGAWWYAADRQRFNCGTHLRVVNPANNACVVLQVADAGPDICVEQAAGRPVLDATPLASMALFGSSGLGWSDGRVVHVSIEPATTPLGPCMAPPPPPPVDASPPTQADASPPDASSPDASAPPPPQPDAGTPGSPDAAPPADNPGGNPGAPPSPTPLVGGCSVVF